MRRVLASDFGIWPRLRALQEISDRMLASPAYRAKLANYILLYEQVVIPTGNLLIVPVLRLMLGEAVFDEMLRNKAIVLARIDQWFGYAGNGNGLVSFRISADPNRHDPAPNLGLIFFKPLDEAIAEALAATNPPSSAARRAEITNLLLDNVISLPADKLIGDDFTEETYNDILGSPYLRDMFALRNSGRSLKSLLGIRGDQVTFCTPHDDTSGVVPEIAAVLRVAFENFLLNLGGHVQATDITGDGSTLSILRAKGQRLGCATEGARAFAAVQEVSGVPDLGRAFAMRQLSPEQVLDLRHSKHAQALRDWFAQGAPHETTDETLRRYVEGIGNPTLLETLPAKILRFAVTTALGLIEPISGMLASAADTFLLSKWFPGRSPRLFMKQAKVMLADTPIVPKPSIHGRDRNKPCFCGSGKKFKKCCGAS